MTGILIRRGDSAGAERKRLCEDRGRDWSDAATAQDTRSQQRLKEAERSLP